MLVVNLKFVVVIYIFDDFISIYVCLLGLGDLFGNDIR